MSSGVLLQDLVAQDFGYRPGSGKWGKAIKHDSLVVNEETQTWFWNSEGIFGNVLDYLTKIRKIPIEKAQELGKVYSSLTINIPPLKEKNSKVVVYEKLLEYFYNNGLSNRQYWYDRLLTDDTIEKFQLGYYNGWYTIPIIVDGRVVDFQLRRDIPKKRIIRWYQTNDVFLFNQDILQYLEKVFVTEGTVDAMLLVQYGFPSIALNGNNIWKAEWFQRFIGIKDIVYIEDNDKAGRKASRTIANNLGIERVRILRFGSDFPEKFDTVDFFREGHTKEDFLEFVEKNAKFLYQME